MEKRLLRVGRAGLPALGLWQMTPFVERLPPALLLHGATFGAAIFDLELSGYSLMRLLAAEGRMVYALDVRGYGSSMNLPEMNAPAARHPPLARARDAAEDIAAAVRFISETGGGEIIDLVGFSWGTINACLYAQANGARVRRLALYAPLYGEPNELWQKRIGCTNDPGVLAGRYGAYRLISLADVLQRWDEDLHDADPAQFREPAVAEALFDAQAALDPQSRARSPHAFRCPNGALADLIEVFNGKPLYEPAALKMPVLLVRGEQDTTATQSDAKRLMGALADARYRAIPGGSHFLCVEKNRGALYEELRSFLSS